MKYLLFSLVNEILYMHAPSLILFCWTLNVFQSSGGKEINCLTQPQPLPIGEFHVVQKRMATDMLNSKNDNYLVSYHLLKRNASFFSFFPAAVATFFFSMAREIFWAPKRRKLSPNDTIYPCYPPFQLLLLTHTYKQTDSVDFACLYQWLQHQQQEQQQTPSAVICRQAFSQ